MDLQASHRNTAGKWDQLTILKYFLQIEVLGKFQAWDDQLTNIFFKSAVPFNRLKLSHRWRLGNRWQRQGDSLRLVLE